MQWKSMTAVVAIALVIGLAGPASRPDPAHAQAASTREIAFVANAEAGTVSLVDVAARTVLGEINVNPQRIVVQRAGTPNYAQDTDVSPDGRTLYVSRAYLGDAAAFDIATGAQHWRLVIDPTRADHMALTPDGRSLFVSALTSNRVLRVDTATGRATGRIVSGVYPHDNQISKDGRRLYNASLGNMGVPVERRDNVEAVSEQSGYAYQLTIVDTETLQVIDAIRFREGIRPFHLTPDEKGFYAQMSNAHAVFAYALGSAHPTSRLDLPVKAGVTAADWDFEAYHHGLSLTPDGKTLCLAGRASDYAALVSAPELSLIATIPVGDAPGWAELADAGRLCLIANTRSNSLSIISVARRSETARLPMGKGPKHITVARVPTRVIEAFRARVAAGK